MSEDRTQFKELEQKLRAEFPHKKFNEEEIYQAWDYYVRGVQGEPTSDWSHRNFCAMVRDVFNTTEMCNGVMEILPNVALRRQRSIQDESRHVTVQLKNGVNIMEVEASLPHDLTIPGQYTGRISGFVEVTPGQMESIGADYNRNVEYRPRPDDPVPGPIELIPVYLIQKKMDEMNEVLQKVSQENAKMQILIFDLKERINKLEDPK